MKNTLDILEHKENFTGSSGLSGAKKRPKQKILLAVVKIDAENEPPKS